MSLNRTLDRLFGEIRREAKRNPAFADRLDAALRAHASGRAIDPDAVADLDDPTPEAGAPPPAPPPLNPVAVFTRGGEEALARALAAPGFTRPALVALIAEHNLDPTGAMGEADEPALRLHIIAQAKKRVERDKKLFDY